MSSNPPEQPTPAPKSHTGEANESSSPTDEFALPPRRYAPANRRVASAPTHRFYLGALVFSTLIAALFCVLYISKPVLIAPVGEPLRTVQKEITPEPAETTDTPPHTKSPEEKSTPATHTSATHDGHEETNLRVQHVLNTSTPGGELSRIVLDVPVIYASRNLRWTHAEIAQAREILHRLADYHEQSRRLRDLGTDIMLDWNQLIERSIPATELRADSPSLPANQESALPIPQPATLNTNESIEIRPSGP